MRYGNVMIDGSNYIALFDDLISIDKDGNIKVTEEMLQPIAPQSDFDVDNQMSVYDELNQVIKTTTQSFLSQKSFSVHFNPVELFVTAFLYKFVGQDILDDMGSNKNLFIHLVAQKFIKLQSPQYGFLGKRIGFLDTSPLVFLLHYYFYSSAQEIFNALGELASFKEPVVKAVQSNLDKLGYYNKSLAFYDCSEASFCEDDLESKIAQRLKMEITNRSLFRLSDIQYGLLTDYLNPKHPNFDLSPGNSFNELTQSLINHSFTMIPNSDQLMDEDDWIANCLPVISYALVMDQHGMIVDFDIINPKEVDQHGLIDAIKDMQNNHGFANMVFYSDNEWTSPWQYVTEMRENGISYMINDHFQYYNTAQIKELVSSGFVESSLSTLVNGAELDACLYSSFERISYAIKPFEFSFKLKNSERLQLLEKSFPSIDSKSKADVLFDQENHSLVMRGNTFLTHMPSLEIKDILLYEEFNYRSPLVGPKKTHGLKSFECNLQLSKQVGAKTGMMKSFIRVNTAKNLFKKSLDSIDFNCEAEINCQMMCGHMLTVYLAMVLRQLIQFHPHQEGKVLSHNDANKMFQGVYSDFVEKVILPIPAQPSDIQENTFFLASRFLNGEISFTNPYVSIFNPEKSGKKKAVSQREQEDLKKQAQRIAQQCEALGFNPEYLKKKSLSLSHLAKFFDLPKDLLHRVVCEFTFNHFKYAIATKIYEDFKYSD